MKFRRYTANFLQVMRSARNALPYEALCSALIGCFRYLFQTEPPEKFEIIEEVTSKYVKVERMKCYNYYFIIIIIIIIIIKTGCGASWIFVYMLLFHFKHLEFDIVDNAHLHKNKIHEYSL